MTFRILAGKFIACLGTGLLLLTIFAAMQQGVEAAGGIVCTGCIGCSGATVNGPNGLICVGSCSTTDNAICDNRCSCRPNAAGTGCNCANPIIVVGPVAL